MAVVAALVWAAEVEEEVLVAVAGVEQELGAAEAYQHCRIQSSGRDY